MASEQETLIYVEENDKAEAGAQTKGFAKNSVKNRAYINTLGVELGLKYLASEGINVSNLHNLHSVHKFLEEFDIADIILPNVHIDVRVVFNDKYIFVPKSHFEYGLTPDIYLVLQLAEDHSHVKALGFFKPELINKKDANKDYYFIQKEKLTHINNLKTFIETASNNTTQELDENTLFLSEARFISMIDNDITNEDKKDLIGTLLKSDELRDRLIEFSNFEILSYKAVNDNDMQNVIENTASDINPQAATPLITEAVDMISEEPAQKEELTAQTLDEFELFDNSTDEFDTQTEETPAESHEELNITTDAEALEFEPHAEENIPEITEDITITEPQENSEETAQDDLSLDEILAEPDMQNILTEEDLSANQTVDLLFTDNTEDENHASDSDIEFIDTQSETEVSEKDEMLGYTSPPEDNTGEQELINFDDIDVSLPENIEEYRHDEYGTNDAVAFDVLEPMALNVDLSDDDETGSFITTLSEDGKTTLEKTQTPELKTDIIDEQITGIGALDTLGFAADIENNIQLEDSINLDLIDSETEKTQLADKEISVDINSLPTLDTIDNFDNLNIEENIKPVDDTEETLPDADITGETLPEIEEFDISNLEELSSTENSTGSFTEEISGLEPIENINTGNIDDLSSDIAPLPAIDDLSLEPEMLTELNDNTQNLETSDNIDDLKPIENLESLNFEQELTPPEVTEADNTENDLPESLSFDNIMPLEENNSAVIDPEITEIKEDSTIENNQELLNFTMEELPELTETDENTNNQNSEEIINFETDSLPEINEISDNTVNNQQDELLSFAPDELPEVPEAAEDNNSSNQDEPLNFTTDGLPEINESTDNNGNNQQDELLSFASDELPELTENSDTSENSNPDEMLNFTDGELPEVNTMSENGETNQQNELLSFAPDELPEETNTSENNTSENQNELLNFASDELSMKTEQSESVSANETSELLSFADDNSSQTTADEIPFTLLEESGDAPKPMNPEEATLTYDTPEPKSEENLSAGITNDLSEMPAELDSKNLLAEIDTLLGTDSQHDNDDDDDENEVEFIAPEQDSQSGLQPQPGISDHELTPEETIYMQTMAKEKGKKGMTMLLVVVAALMGVLTLTTFIKNGKSSQTASLPTASEGEIIDNLSNPPETLPVEQPPVETNIPVAQPPKTPAAPETTAVKSPTEMPAAKVTAAPVNEPVVKGQFAPEIKKVTFEIPDYLSYSEGIRKYLQTVGRSVKLSATSDLLLTTDYSKTDRVKVALTLTPAGNIKKADIAISSGSDQIDQIVLQSVKNTLNIVKPPADEVKGDEFNLAVIMKF